LTRQQSHPHGREFSKTTLLVSASHTDFWACRSLRALRGRRILDGTVIAFREVNGMEFINPFLSVIKFSELNVTETKALPRIGGGSVMLEVE